MPQVNWKEYFDEVIGTFRNDCEKVITPNALELLKKESFVNLPFSPCQVEVLTLTNGCIGAVLAHDNALADKSVFVKNVKNLAESCFIKKYEYYPAFIRDFTREPRYKSSVLLRKNSIMAIPDTPVELTDYFIEEAMTFLNENRTDKLLSRSVIEKSAVDNEKNEEILEHNRRIIELQELINNLEEEPKFQHFFELNPVFLDAQVHRCYSKKSFGGEQFPDFVLELKNANYLIVEIEKPGVKLFTENGNPTKELSHAEQQIRDYMNWAFEEKDYLRRRGLDKLSANNVTGLLIIGSDLLASDRKRLQMLNSSIRGTYIIKTFRDILSEREAILTYLNGKR